MRELKWNTRSALTLLELLFVVSVIAILAALAIPNFHGSHGSPANACINNLRCFDAAANQFALEHSLTNGDRIHFPNDLTPYIKLNNAGKTLGCPMGGVYHINKVGETPTCSLGSTVTPTHVLP